MKETKFRSHIVWVFEYESMHRKSKLTEQKAAQCLFRAQGRNGDLIEDRLKVEFWGDEM